MKKNVKKVFAEQTHEGGKAFPHMKPIQALRGLWDKWKLRKKNRF